jgi:hypothetical protein
MRMNERASGHKEIVLGNVKKPLRYFRIPMLPDASHTTLILNLHRHIAVIAHSNKNQRFGTVGGLKTIN